MKRKKEGVKRKGEFGGMEGRFRRFRGKRLGGGKLGGGRRARRAGGVSQGDLLVFPEEALNTLPVALVVADAVAVHTDR